MNNDIIIKPVSPSDAAQLAEIYRPYVENTAVSFEYTAPTAEEFARRIESTLQKYPYIAAAVNGEIVGYAYASAFKDRRAYDWAAETSIYIKEGFTSLGYGKKLYLALEDILKKQNVINLNACIAYTDIRDEYLTDNSMKFHEHMGYSLVGKFTDCGCKFGKWYDMIWMEKMIGEHLPDPKSFIPFPCL